MSDTPLKEIGKYHILELIGEGAMGIVYRAKDSVLDRTVAIKVMNASIARQQDLRQRFLREAQAAGSLQHPNVVTIYDLGELEGHLFIAMEYVAGVDLETLMSAPEPMKLQEKLDIVVDVLTGLAYAHKRGIVHRDIKPANIRIGEDGRAKIMDFGVAHLASSSITRTGLVVGTPSYMAPEQVTGGKTTAATDLFAVGAVLYQLLTGHKPFEAPTLQSLFYKIVSEMPRPMSEVSTGIPPTLDRIIRKAMAKNPLERYVTALEMANEISAVRSEMSGAPYPATVSLSSTVASAIIPPTQKSRFSTRQIATIAGAAVIVAAGVATIWGQTRRGDSSSDDGVATASLADTTPTAAIDTLAAPTKSQVAAAPSPATAAKIDTSPAATKVAPETKSEPTPLPPPAPRVETRRSGLSPAQRLADAVAKRRDLQRARAAQTPATPPRVAVNPPAPRIQAPVVQPQAPPPQVRESVPALTPRTLPPPPPPAADPTPGAAPSAADVSTTVASYARAIESRDMGAIRRVYPGITSEQQRGFEQFFQFARSINVTFRVTGVEVSGNSADARLSGTYEYVTTGGKNERQPVSFAASLRHDGSAWRLVSVR